MSGHLCASCTPAPVHDDYVMPTRSPSLVRQDAAAASSTTLGRSPNVDHMKMQATTVPAGTMARGSRKSRRGQFIATTYDICANRPRPSLTTPLTQQISCCLRYDDFAFVTSGVGFVGASLILALNIFDSYTDFTALFDQYRFDYVEAWIETSVPRVSGAVGDMASAVDVDDASVPTSYLQVADRPGAIDCAWAAGRYHKWKPHVAVAMYSGAFTSFGNEPAGWIDCGSPAVQHYGLKVGLAPFSGGATAFKLHVRAMVTFRGAIN